jgi:COP9 signalosome complex subunit 1
MTGTTVVSSDNFNVVDYAAGYQGFTKLARLQFICDNFPQLRHVSNKQLLKELKNSSNASYFVKVLHSVDEPTRRELACDESIAHAITQNNQMRMDLLENELSTAKSTMLKEGIRAGHTDVGHLAYQMGNLSEAMKSYMRSRDFCTMPRHVIEMCLNVIVVSIDLKQFFNVTNFASKVADTMGDDVVVGKLKVGSALVDLNERHFKAAAVKFLEVPPVLGNQFNNVVSEQDIAVYGTICALATFDRSELRSRLIENKPFINAYLNLVPDFKAMALGFYNGDYASAFSMLEAVRPRLLCDMYLNAQVDSLVAQLRERLLLQYFTPYSCVDLARMAAQLQMQPTALEDALVELISSGKLAARIDAGSNTLQRRERNVRDNTLQKVLSGATVHAHAIRRDIFRLSMLQQGFVLGDGEDGGGGRGGMAQVGPERGSLSRQHSGNGGEGRDPEASYGDGMMDFGVIDGGVGGFGRSGSGVSMGGYEYSDAATAEEYLHGDGAYASSSAAGAGAGYGVHVMSQSTVGDDALARRMEENEMSDGEI